MPFPGDTKRAYCTVCGHETQWQYIVVEYADGVFGVENIIAPESHQIKLWRCCEHATGEGRMKRKYKRYKPTNAEV